MDGEIDLRNSKIPELADLEDTTLQEEDDDHGGHAPITQPTEDWDQDHITPDDKEEGATLFTQPRKVLGMSLGGATTICDLDPSPP